MIVRHIATGLALVVTLGLAACAPVRIAEDAFFYPNERVRAEGMVLPVGPAFPEGSETLSLPYEGGAVAATRVRGSAGGPIILFCGGNLFRRETVGAMTAQTLTPFGDVVLFDYPGYGDTPGTADLASFRQAGAAVAAWVARTAEAEGRDVIAWGHSLGGPVCAEATRLINIDTVVIEASTPTARAVVNDSLGLLRPFVRVDIDPGLDSFNVVETLSDFDGEVIVLEAGRDETLPARLSRDLANGLRAGGVDVARLVFPEAGHNNIRRQPDFRARLEAALTP